MVQYDVLGCLHYSFNSPVMAFEEFFPKEEAYLSYATLVIYVDENDIEKTKFECHVM